MSKSIIVYLEVVLSYNRIKQCLKKFNSYFIVLNLQKIKNRSRRKKRLLLNYYFLLYQLSNEKL